MTIYSIGIASLKSCAYNRIFGHIHFESIELNVQTAQMVLNRIFNRYGVDWDVSITRKYGDATEFARRAAESGFDLVAGYGGDGTQMEVANGLLGSGVPQAILPGGTGNAMAHDLGISLVLQEATELILARSTSILIAHRLSTIRRVDRIIVLEGGRIIEQGNHGQLMAQGGHYAELYDTYFRHQSPDYRPPPEQETPVAVPGTAA